MERDVLGENMIQSDEGRTDGPRWAEVQQEVRKSVDKHEKGGAIFVQTAYIHLASSDTTLSDNVMTVVILKLTCKRSLYLRTK